MKVCAMISTFYFCVTLVQSFALNTEDDVPELPAVASMISTETDTLKDITSQADVLRARVVQIQTDNEAHLAKQRAILEHELKKQTRNNRAINMTNANIRKQIESLEVGNVVLTHDASDLRKSNERLVAEIRTLQSRVSTSKDFLATSLGHTDDQSTSVAIGRRPVSKFDNSNAPRLTAAAQHHDPQENSEDAGDDADNADDTDFRNDGTSFLALSMTRRAREPAANPNDLLSSLSKRVKSFAAQAQDSEATLQTAYTSAYTAGEHQRSALLAEQTKLNATRSSLLVLQEQLRTSDDELSGIKAEYQRRLRGFGLFLQRLAHIALAPENMVSQLMQDVPDNIAVPSLLVKEARLVSA